MGSVIFKMTGSGNDFVFADGRTDPLAEWTTERIQDVCSRRMGVGADGLVVLAPGSKPGAVRFDFFNNDGSHAPMCGNAALCATTLAARLEMVPAGAMELETDAGTFQTRGDPNDPDRAEIRLADVTDAWFPPITPIAGEGSIGFATVGVPHLVVPVDDLDAVDVPIRGRALRFDAALPAGANVNFVGQKPGGEWAMRTYERGVEAETLACGTGAVASAVFLAVAGRIELPWTVMSRAGLPISVHGLPKSSGPNPGLLEPRLGGQGRLVFTGVLQAGR
ncbi:MAG TPA: diaminopimelate epimerase [Gemmatimonadales bacterium]